MSADEHDAAVARGPFQLHFDDLVATHAAITAYGIRRGAIGQLRRLRSRQPAQVRMLRSRLAVFRDPSSRADVVELEPARVLHGDFVPADHRESVRADVQRP